MITPEIVLGHFWGRETRYFCETNFPKHTIYYGRTKEIKIK
jgi:hypothetical protein